MHDCGFTKENLWFRYRAAAIIVENDCVLFACNELDDYLYSIGGGVHVGETAEAAVLVGDPMPQLADAAVAVKFAARPVFSQFDWNRPRQRRAGLDFQRSLIGINICDFGRNFFTVEFYIDIFDPG